MATYVQITRDEFEDWLNSLKYKWSRVSGKEGVYVVHLSNVVGVKISSSMTGRDDVMERGRAAIHMAMASLINGRVINKKAQGQSHFKRTTNWRKSLLNGIDRFEDVYKKAKDFYDRIATVDDPREYQSDMLKRIEAIPGWEDDEILSSFHEQVKKGRVLSEKQEGLLERKEKGGGSKAPEKDEGPDEEFLEKMRKLYLIAKREGDDWLVDFLTSVGQQYKSRGYLSDKQRSVIEKGFRRYRVSKGIEMDNQRIAGELVKLARALVGGYKDLKPTAAAKKALSKAKKILKGWDGESFKDIGPRGIAHKNFIQFVATLPTKYKSVDEAVENWEENGSSFQRRMKQQYGATSGEELYQAMEDYYNDEVKRGQALARKVQSAVGNLFRVESGSNEGRNSDYMYIALHLERDALEPVGVEASGRSAAVKDADSAKRALDGLKDDIDSIIRDIRITESDPKTYAPFDYKDFDGKLKRVQKALAELEMSLS